MVGAVTYYMSRNMVDNVTVTLCVENKAQRGQMSNELALNPNLTDPQTQTLKHFDPLS